MVRGRGFTTLVAGAAITAGLAVATPAATAAAADGRRTAATAPGAPGAPSYFDLARKDCVGTAAGRGSKVWYTVAGGVLSDVYEPTIDNTDVSTLQYIVTDGATFTDLQARDMTYTVAADPTGMACTVTSTDAKHGFRLVTTYITDPASDTVLMNTRLQDLPGPAPTWPACTCTPGSTPTSTATAEAAARTRAPTPGWSTPPPARRSRWSSARTRSRTPPTGITRCRPTWPWPARPTQAASVGYAGTASDGLTQLDAAHTLTALHLRAGRPHRGHRERDPGPRPRGDPRAGLRPDPGAVGLRRRGLAEPPVRPDRGQVRARLGRLRRRARGGRPAWTATTTCRPTS